MSILLGLLIDILLQELAAVMSAIVVDGFKATNAYFKFQASDRVKEVYDELDKLSWDLRIMQGDASLEFPINMCREVGGLTESWVNGASWRELCRDTSMDQGTYVTTTAGIKLTL